MNRWRVKPVTSEADSGLRRTLGPGALVSLGVGAIVGTGIFVLTGVAAAQHAGPALLLSFLIAGVACALAALCYAEFAAMIPVSGSAYSYAYATLGEGVAFFVGWQLVLEYLFAVSTVAVGWSGYLVSLLRQVGLTVPASISSAPLAPGAHPGHVIATGALCDLPAILVIALVTVICYVGVEHTSRFNTAAVVIKVAVILLFVACGIAYIDPSNWTPFIPPAEGPGRYGLDGVFRASSVIFFAYLGFDAVSTAAQEARNPQRDMPIGIIGSLIVCTILYLAVSAVLTGMVPYTQLDVPAPVALALDRHPELGWLSGLIKLGAIAGMTSVIVANMLGQPRIFWTMARDGLLPPAFARIHPRFRTPGFSTIVTGAGASLIAGALPIDILGELVSFGTLAAFLVVCLGVLVLRRTRPDLRRPFRVPFAPAVCLSGAAACTFLMAQLSATTWALAGGWTVVGTAIYLIYGIRHSALAPQSGIQC